MSKTTETVGWLASYVFRPSVFLIVGLAIGYYVGFTDAFREGDTLGTRVAVALGRVAPDQVRATREARAAALRDTIHARAGVITPEY